MKVGKIFSTAGKVAGTVVVGGVGIVAGIFESGTSTASKDLSDGIGQVRKGCFNTVKKNVGSRFHSQRRR